MAKHAVAEYLMMDLLVEITWLFRRLVLRKIIELDNLGDSVAQENSFENNKESNHWWNLTFLFCSRYEVILSRGIILFIFLFIHIYYIDYQPNLHAGIEEYLV